MKQKTCCITGHRQLYDDKEIIKEHLRQTIVSLIENGISYFGVGGARGFDSIAAEIIIELKQIYTHIRLIIVLPCRNHTTKWNYEDSKLYEKISLSADKIKILSQEYYKGCMHARNRHLVNHS